MDKRVRIYQSFEEENEAEYRRRAQMTPEEPMQDLAELRARYYGEDWAEKLLEMKRISGGAKDLADIEELMSTNPQIFSDRL